MTFEEGTSIHETGTIEVTPWNTTKGEEWNRGTRTTKGAIISAEIRTTNVVITIGEMSVVTLSRNTDKARTQAKHFRRAQ